MSEDAIPGGAIPERELLTSEDVPADAIDAIQSEFGSAFDAADHAFRGGDRLEQIDGVGPSTVDGLADMSPLNAPGEWDATKSDSGAYTWTAGGAELRMSPGDGERWTLDVDRPDGADLISEYRVRQDVPRDRVGAWWAARNVMERNPHGPDSIVPRNVETGDEWGIRVNHFSFGGGHRAGWKREDTGEWLDIHEQDGVCTLSYREGIASGSSELARGGWLDMLTAAGRVMSGPEPVGPDVEVPRPEVCPEGVADVREFVHEQRASEYTIRYSDGGMARTVTGEVSSITHTLIHVQKRDSGQIAIPHVCVEQVRVPEDGTVSSSSAEQALMADGGGVSDE